MDSIKPECRDCEIDEEILGVEKFNINFIMCPLHASAKEMYEALNAVRGLLALEDCDWATAIVRSQVNRALIKAEFKK